MTASITPEAVIEEARKKHQASAVMLSYNWYADGTIQCTLTVWQSDKRTFVKQYMAPTLPLLLANIQEVGEKKQ